MIKSFKKMMPLMLLVMAVALVVQVGSAFAATSQNFNVLKPDGTISTWANSYAVKPASVASDGETVTLAFNDTVYIQSLTIVDGSTSTTHYGTIVGSTRVFTFTVDDFSVNTQAKLHVVVPGVYDTVHDIQFKWL